MSVGETLFRKVALDRLASPDRLDALAGLARPRLWLLWSGIAILAVSTVAWAWFGTVTQRVSGRCILISPRGIADITSSAEGRIIEVAVRIGDVVQPGQPIARIVRPELYEQIEAARGRLADLRQRRDELARYGAASERLARGLRGSEQQNLNALAALADDKRKAAESRFEVERSLFEQGLLTRQALLATEQRAADAALEAEAIRNRTKQSSLQRLEDERRLQAESAEIGLHVKDAERALDSMLNVDLKTSTVLSPYAGRVIEIKATRGVAVAPGAAVAAIERVSDRPAELEAVVYASASEGKLVAPGMPVEIVPSTVKRQEYGFLRGEVRESSEYPASALGMRLLVQNDAIIRELSGGRVPMQIQTRLVTDPASGSYVWSAAAHAPPPVRSGTLCDADVVVAKRRPVSMLLPALRRWLGLA